jgi:hypothetical protein
MNIVIVCKYMKFDNSIYALGVLMISQLTCHISIYLELYVSYTPVHVLTYKSVFWELEFGLCPTYRRDLKRWAFFQTAFVF